MFRKSSQPWATRHPQRLGRRRRGAAVVEFAVCLPIILILALGSIEAASVIFLRQALVQSAYETIKEGVRANGDVAVALQRGEQVLDFRGIDGETITFSPPNVGDLPRGTPVTVTVTAPSDANSIIPFGPFQGQEITVNATMLKE